MRAGVGAYVIYEGENPHENLPKWSVKPLVISRTKRYLDAGVVNQFWALVDKLIYAEKARMFLPPEALGAGAAAAAGKK